MVFPEAYVPGYPVWIWRLRPEADFELTGVIYRELLANSIDLVADGLRPLRDAAAERGVAVVCGIHEREGEFSRATLYNTLVTIGADGAVLNRHRKLMPTNPERMVWGQGDASARAARGMRTCRERIQMRRRAMQAAVGDRLHVRGRREASPRPAGRAGAWGGAIRVRIVYTRVPPDCAFRGRARCWSWRAAGMAVMHYCPLAGALAWWPVALTGSWRRELRRFGQLGQPRVSRAWLTVTRARSG